MKPASFLILVLFFQGILAQAPQEEIPIVKQIPLQQQPMGTQARYWLQVGSDVQGRPEVVAVLVARGVFPGPVFGITAGVHGNELNGVRTVQKLMEAIDPSQLKGTVLAVAGMNPQGMANHDRRFPDGEDLNRGFPGKAEGNESQQMTHILAREILPHLDYLADLHTASFGRENSLYIRADLGQDSLAQMALGFGADIVLNSKEASAGGSTDGTLRATAASQGIPGFTVELGNPQVFQPKMIDRGVAGLLRTLGHLGMRTASLSEPAPPVICKRSYWIYTDRGGLLEVAPHPGDLLEGGQLIAILRDAFGQEITRYYAPESGVVIGTATNPAVRSGGRVLHIGILAATEGE